VPHVASKASVLHSQQSGLSRRERTAEANESASPFSILLTETDSPPSPARHHASRPAGSTPTQRSDAPRMHRTDAQRPQRPENESADDAPEATEVPEDAAIDALALVAKAEPVAVTPEQSPEPPEKSSVATAEDEPLTVNAALAAVVEAPASPPPLAATDTAPPVDAAMPVADGPATPAAPAAPTDAGTAEPAAVAPAGTTPPVTADAVVGAGEPVPPQVPQPQTPQQTDPAAQQTNTLATPHARPSTERAASAPASADLPQPSTPPDAAAPATDPEQAETKSAPKDTAHADTPSQPSARSNAPDAAAERPQPGNAVRDVVHATQPITDPSQLAHLQSGRDFGQVTTTTAHVLQSADASNPLASAPVPLESLAVEIAARVQPGRSRFEIRLDPPELGRVEVRLDIDRSGNVTSRLVVEKAETLDVLRRDAHQLERALQEAGLKTSDNSLQFSLRDQAFAERRDQNGSDRQHVHVADPERPATENAAVTYGLTLRGGSGVDIRV
jgi:flagellar hook-length control protein FliK